MTHPSFSLKHNQRHEFFGDAVLEMIISQALYNMKPNMQEGMMTSKRASLVREETLADVANSIQLGRFILMSKDCESGGGRSNKAILSDAMEALLAAVYLDGGMDAANEMVLRLWEKKLTSTDESMDSKGALQAHLQGLGRAEPTYQLISASGPAHKRMFEMAVLIDGVEKARAVASTKKRAEMEAAKQALNQMTRQDAKDEA